MAKHTTDTEYARSWLAQRRDSLRLEMEAQQAWMEAQRVEMEARRTGLAILQGRTEEIDRLIGELDQAIIPPKAVLPVAAGPPQRSAATPKRAYKRSGRSYKNPTLRQAILTTLRAARGKGIRMAELRDAVIAKGFTVPYNYVSSVLYQEKALGHVAHNMHTGRHRWLGEGAATAEPEPPPSTPPVSRPAHRPYRLGQIGENRKTIREVLQLAGDGGMTKASIHQACEAKGVSMSGNLLGVTLIADRRLGYVSYDEPTGAYHWIGPTETEPNRQTVSCRVLRDPMIHRTGSHVRAGWRNAISHLGAVATTQRARA
jgi:hypothetical protein